MKKIVIGILIGIALTIIGYIGLLIWIYSGMTT